MRRPLSRAPVARNVALEYPKHWNASYLVTYGLKDDYSQSFHGTIDYRKTGEAADSAYKDSVYHKATDDTSVFGRWVYNVFDSNDVQTSCLLYNAAASNGHPASRAGDFMHEGWHGWMDKYDYDNGSVGGHRPTQGNCTAKGCDYFYWHGISAYAFGAMYQTDGTANRFHSPNQVQVEFLCDMANPQRNVVGTGSTDGLNTVKVSDQMGTQHRYFITYTENNSKPDYSIFIAAINSFKLAQ